MSRRCDCHDLLVEDCDALRGALTRERAAAVAELERLARLIALPGVVPAQYAGRCGRCGEPFLQGSPIRSFPATMGDGDTWVADCCLTDTGGLRT